MTPKKISLANEKTLRIEWESGDISDYPLRTLRKQCPCATCRADQENQGPSYIPLYSKDALTIQRIDSLGRYAIQINWRDGHSTGIYSYDFLQAIDPSGKQ